MDSASSSKNSRNYEKTWQLLQPELISVDSLLRLFHERLIIVPDDVKGDKEQLVNLYKRVILPLPQRTFTARRRTPNTRAGDEDTPVPKKKQKLDENVEENHRETQNGKSAQNHNDQNIAANEVKTCKIKLKRRVWPSSTSESANCDEISATVDGNTKFAKETTQIETSKTNDNISEPPPKKPREVVTWP